MKPPARRKRQRRPATLPFAAAKWRSITCSSRSYRIDIGRLQTVTGVICESLGVGDYALAINFVSSPKIRQLNRQFRGKDRPTDVLSFPQNEWKAPLRIRKVGKVGRAYVRQGGAGEFETGKNGKRVTLAGPPPVLGDVIISLSEAERSAKCLGQPLAREVCFLLAHGILHLCGHDHQLPEDERRMRLAQRSLMRRLTPPGVQPIWQKTVLRRRRPLRSH